MINLRKNNTGRRINMYNVFELNNAPKTTNNNEELLIVIDGENVANIYKNGFIDFSGFKSVSEIENLITPVKFDSETILKENELLTRAYSYMTQDSLVDFETEKGVYLSLNNRCGFLSIREYKGSVLIGQTNISHNEDSGAIISYWGNADLDHLLNILPSKN